MEYMKYLKAMAWGLGALASSGCSNGILYDAALQKGLIKGPSFPKVEHGFTTYNFSFLNRYQITHDYLFGPGVEDCHYGKQGKSKMMNGYSVFIHDKVGDMVERDGKLYQFSYWQRMGGWYEADMSGHVIGMEMTYKIPGVAGQKYRSFEPICADWVNTNFNFLISLKKESAESIKEQIEEIKMLSREAWKGSSWEEPTRVQRAGNQWILFRHRYPAMYLADQSEEWYLPVADTGYYYRVSFSYRSDAPENSPDEYGRFRAAFDRIIDSFKIEPVEGKR